MHSNGTTTLPPLTWNEQSSTVAQSDSDWMPRPRDSKGNSVGRTSHWDAPHLGQPLAKSALQPLLERIDPLAARFVAWRHELLYHTYQRYQRLQEEVAEQFEARQKQAEIRNRELESQLEQLRVAKEQACASLVQQRESLELELGQAQLQAAQAVSAAGSNYDPNQPERTQLMAAGPDSVKPYLARLGLPDPGDDQKAMLHWALGYLGTALVGTLLGISLGMLAGFVYPATLTRRLLPTLLCAAVGMAPALFMRKALNSAFRLASEQGYLGGSLLGRAFSLGTGLLLLVLFALIDCAVEYHGLLKLAKLDAGLSGLSGASATPTVEHLGYYAVACVVTLGYLAYSCYEGWFGGRRQVIMNQAIQLQHSDQAEQLQQRAELRRALESLASVREVARRKGLTEQRLQALEKEHDQRIAALEKQRRELHDEPTLVDKQRVQDALDNLKGAQVEFDKLLASLITVRESWWQRLGRRLFGL